VRPVYVVYHNRPVELRQGDPAKEHLFAQALGAGDIDYFFAGQNVLRVP
jgi:hypothetical protein